MRTALALIALICLPAGLAEAAGLQRIAVPSGDGSPALEGAVWYPCAAQPETIEFQHLELAGVPDCPVEGEALPLIVMSHGARGWFAGHHDTAEALADAGYVVAAITHPDADRQRWRTDRPAAVKRLIDHMLGVWPERGRLDGERIGFFGFSRGGYTGLVLIGGQPNFWRMFWHCLLNWGAEMCKRPPDRKAQDGEDAAEGKEDSAKDSEDEEPAFVHDPRIKAAVIAAPIGLVFSDDGLEAVNVPLQLWRAENDELLEYPHHAEAVYEALPDRTDYRVVPDAGHFAFLAPCRAAHNASALVICKDPPGFDRVAFHEELNAEVLAFFEKTLRKP